MKISSFSLRQLLLEYFTTETKRERKTLLWLNPLRKGRHRDKSIKEALYIVSTARKQRKKRLYSYHVLLSCFIQHRTLAMRWCSPHSICVLSSLVKPLLHILRGCILGDSKSSQLGNEDQPSVDSKGYENEAVIILLWKKGVHHKTLTQGLADYSLLLVILLYIADRMMAFWLCSCPSVISAPVINPHKLFHNLDFIEPFFDL